LAGFQDDECSSLFNLNQIFQHKATFFHGGPVNSTDNEFLEIVPITRKAFFHSNPTAYEIIPLLPKVGGKLKLCTLTIFKKQKHE
jgi:hypothetical protein